MNITFNNAHDTSDGFGMILNKQQRRQRIRSRSERRDNIIQERLREKQLEKQIRAREDKQIKALQERIQEISEEEDLCLQHRLNKISGLTDMITRIHEKRAERELQAVEREVARQKTLLEESARPENESRQCQEPVDPEEAEKAQQRDQIMGMTRIAVNQQRLTALKQNRASMALEAGNMRRSIESENSNHTKMGVIYSPHVLAQGRGIIISPQSGYGNSQDFRNRHLAKLNLGIARTDAFIRVTISSMYRESSRLQETQLAQYRQQPEETCEEEEKHLKISL